MGRLSSWIPLSRHSIRLVCHTVSTVAWAGRPFSTCMALMAGVSRSSVHAQIVHCAQVELEDMTCAHKELLVTVARTGHWTYWYERTVFEVGSDVTMGLSGLFVMFVQSQLLRCTFEFELC